MFNNFIRIAIRVTPFLLTLNYIRLRLHDNNGFKQFIMNLSYNAIYAYSRVQIAVGNALTSSTELINNQPLLKNLTNNAYNVYKSFKKKLDRVEYIKDYKVVGVYPVGYNYLQPVSYDFIIATYHHDNLNVYKKIFYSPDEITCDYEISVVQFMLIEFYIRGECFVINLKDSSHNYYVVDNKINIQFMLYYIYMNYQHRIEMDLLNKNDIMKETCCIRILDQNVNIIEITKYEDYILLKKDEYEIHNS